MIAYQTCKSRGTVWYLSDLKRCDGRRRNGTTCDYGHVSHIEGALAISPYEFKVYRNYYESMGYAVGQLHHPRPSLADEGEKV